LRIRKVKGFLLVVLLYYMENILTFRHCEYCNIWKLKVNSSKSKIIIFSSGRLPQNINFLYDGNAIEIVNHLNILIDVGQIQVPY
jgi:hypothetical protein